MNRFLIKYIKNLFFTIFTVLLFVILLELILFFAPQLIKNSISIPEKGFKLLCVGDSTTFGLGASDRKKFSWPSQLEAIYNNDNPDNPLFIINKALPGINSLQTKKILSASLKDFTPDMVIILTGVNDAWNFSGGQIYEFYKPDKQTEKIKLFLATLLANSKILRFLRLVKISRFGDFTNKTIAFHDKLMPSFDKQAKALSSVINENIKGISALLEERNIPYFFLEYHAPGWANPEKIIHSCYVENKLPYIPMYDYFMKLDNQSLKIRSSDGWHPNDYGYHLLALKVSDYLSLNYNSDFPVFNKHNQKVKR